MSLSPASSLSSGVDAPSAADGSGAAGASPRGEAGSRAPARARSLADDLRARGDDELVRLLQLRPDLSRPAPADLTSLAARAVTRASLARALDDLDTGSLQVLEAVAVLGSANGVGPISRLLGTSNDRVAPLLQGLWERALVWRAGRVSHTPRPVAEALGPYVAGLAPSSSADLSDVVAALTAPADLPGAQRAILERLTWGPPVGRLPDDGAAAAAGRALLAAGLLVPRPAGDVLLPREVALALRGGVLHRRLALRPPDWAGTVASPERVAGTAGASAVHLLGLVDEVVAAWEAHPPRVLRSGGLAVRDLRALAEQLDSPADLTAFVVELVKDAGLVGDDGRLDPTWLPTHDYDSWVGEAAPARWLTLVDAWLGSVRAPHRVGTRPDGSSGPVNALSEGASWPRLRAMRAEVLGELLTAPPGRGVPIAQLLERMSWRHPLRPQHVLREAVEATARAAEWLGVTGLGALPEPVRAVLAERGIHAPDLAPELAPDLAPGRGASADDRSASGDDTSASSDDTAARTGTGSGTFSGSGDRVDAEASRARVVAAIATMLPEPVDRIVLQADLTAVVPGPPAPALAALLRATAERESRGGASVYRFDARSVQRGLDGGRTSQDLLEALARASLTPVPQPLRYLVEDVARRHGALRVGAVGSYVRCEDPAALEILLARRELGAARLRRLAPTVAVSPLTPGALVQALRDAGGAPVLEGLDGVVLTGEGEPERTRRRDLVPVARHAPDAPESARLVARLRAGQEARDRQELAARTQDAGPPLPATDPSVVVALVREAIARRGSLWIGLADGTGATQRLLLHPTRVDGGRVIGHVDDGEVGRGASRERTVSLHRISGAALAQ